MKETQVYEGIGRWSQVADPTFLNDIVDSDILTVVHTGKPTKQLSDIQREPLKDIEMGQVRFVNSSEKAVPWKDWKYEESIDLDEEGLQWPIYRDWTQEAAHLSVIIIRCRA
jgi:hypothetical protein